MILSKVQEILIRGGNPPNPSYLAYITFAGYYLGDLIKETDEHPDARIQVLHRRCTHGVINTVGGGASGTY